MKMESNTRKPQNGKPKFQKPSKRNDGYPDQKGGNNPAWHSPDAKLLEQSASLSWSYQTGEPIETSSVIGVGHSKAKLPGFMVIREKITPGGLNFAGSGRVGNLFQQPATVAANTLLTEMRSRARLRNTYDAPDVIMLELAMANLYGAIIFAKRLAATAKLFAFQNEYIPRDLFTAQGFSWQWFKEHLFDFVSELNVIISEVNKVYVPNRMHFIDLINERWSNYYTEGESVKDQIYIITPAMFSAISYLPTTDWASCLEPVMIMPGKWSGVARNTTTYDANALYTGDDLLDTISYMLGMIVNHDSTPDITGDMMNCFGDGERFIMPACDPTIPAIPVFNEEILETIHNLKVSSAVTSAYLTYAGATDAATTKFKTIQLPTTNEVGEYNQFVVASNLLPLADYESKFKLLDVHKDPNPYKTMEITRMRNNILAYGTDANIGDFVALEFGAELICGVDYYTRKASDGALLRVGVGMTLDQAQSNWYLYIGTMAPFHYRHQVLAINSATGVAPDDVWYFGETDEFTELPDKYQRNMNRISLMTLLGAYAV